MNEFNFWTNNFRKITWKLVLTLFILKIFFQIKLRFTLHFYLRWISDWPLKFNTQNHVRYLWVDPLKFCTFFQKIGQNWILSRKLPDEKPDHSNGLILIGKLFKIHHFQRCDFFNFFRGMRLFSKFFWKKTLDFIFLFIFS